MVNKKSSITTSKLNDFISEINKEGGGEFTLGGAYGFQELWAKDNDGNSHRVEVGSKKDIYEALIKNRYNKKYNPNYALDELSKGGGVKNKKINELLKGYSFELTLDYKKNKISLTAKYPKGKTEKLDWKATDGDKEDWWMGFELNGIDLDINISINYDEGNKAEYFASLYPVTIDENDVPHTNWSDSFSIKKIIVKSESNKTPKKLEFDSEAQEFNKINVDSVISKKSVISELKKLGYGQDNAEEMIAKHSDIYEVNANDKDSSAKNIAMSIDEEENQHGGDDDEMKRGGSVDNKHYYEVVNNFVYFTQNYPIHFCDAFGDKDNSLRKHIELKFDNAYLKHGSYGAMIKFWTDIDDGNRDKLADWIKKNYTGKPLNYKGNTTSIINHFVYFTMNYPNNFMDAFGTSHIKEHLQNKFDRAYEKYRSYGAMIKFWTDLDSENQKKFAEWIEENYKGQTLKYKTGGKVGARGFFELKKGKKITDINDIKVGDIILGHSKQFNSNNTYKVIDRRQYGADVRFDMVYWDAIKNKRIGNEEIGISDLSLDTSLWGNEYYFPDNHKLKLEKGGVMSEEELVNGMLDSNGEISCDELKSIIKRSPCYPVCTVGEMKLRKQFFRGCYKKI